MMNTTNTKNMIIFPDFLYNYGTFAKQEAIKHLVHNISQEHVIITTVIFTFCYLAFQNVKLYKSSNFYKNLYSNKHEDLLKLEDTITILLRKVKVLETRLNMKRRELNSGILITDNDREEMLNDFTSIIRSLPIDANESFTLIQKLANKLDISITIKSGNKKRKNTRLPIRRQPKRSTAPTKFNFGFDEESDDDGITDPDYRI